MAKYLMLSQYDGICTLTVFTESPCCTWTSISVGVMPPTQLLYSSAHDGA